jgi:hypothetical protein
MNKGQIYLYPLLTGFGNLDFTSDLIYGCPLLPFRRTKTGGLIKH